MPTLKFIYPAFPDGKVSRWSEQGQEEHETRTALPPGKSDNAKSPEVKQSDAWKQAEDVSIQNELAANRVYSSRPNLEICKAHLEPDLQKALEETDNLLIRHNHWLNRLVQPMGYKIAPPPAISPLTTYGDTTRLQEAVQSGLVGGFSESFLNTLETVHACKGKSINGVDLTVRQQLRQRQTDELRPYIALFLQSGRNKYELFSRLSQEFADTRTRPLSQADLRMAFEQADAPIRPLGLIWWRLRQFVMKKMCGLPCRN